MASSQDIEVEGVTAFALPPAASYRYNMQLKSDTLSIWMEDCASKKQWYKGDMIKSDYISPANAITDAGPADYLKCFQDALDCEFNASDDASRELEFLKEGAVRLGVTVRIRVLRSTRVAAYTFDLEPVSVERIDVLESKLRDQQDELERLRGDVARGEEVSFTQLVATAKNGTSSNLLWQDVESSDFAVDETLGQVNICRSGVYDILCGVNSIPYDYNETISLCKNSEVVQTMYCSYSSNYYVSTTLSTVARLEQNDVVTVSCGSSVVGTCYLSLARFGR